MDKLNLKMRMLFLIAFLVLIKMPGRSADDSGKRITKCNIEVILTDDMGYSDLPAFGESEIPAPNIDQLASRGIKLTNAYVTSPICVPSRMGLLTGRYQQRFGICGNVYKPEQNRLWIRETILADVLQENGYRTTNIGKWHLSGNDVPWNTSATVCLPEEQMKMLTVGGKSLKDSPGVILKNAGSPEFRLSPGNYVFTIPESNDINPKLPYDLRCEFRVNPLGIEEQEPALSWKLMDDRRGACQTAYCIEVGSSREKLVSGNGDLWNSGRVESDQSHLVPYQGTTLRSRQQAWWRVKYWDQEGRESGWSEPASWEMGLLDSADWKGEWITSPALVPQTGRAVNAWIEKAAILYQPGNSQIDPEILFQAVEKFDSLATSRLSGVTPSILLRKEFILPSGIKQARLFTATLGFHEISINGISIDDFRLEPAIGHYSQRSYYIVRDISANLKEGRNCIGLTLSSGRYNELPCSHSQQYYGRQPATLVYLVVEMENGETFELSSNRSWKTSISSIIMDSFWIGEVHDATREQPGWDKPGFDDTGWDPVVIHEDRLPRELVSQSCPPEREVRRIKPVNISNPAPGVWVFDLGELISGNAELKVNVPRGTMLSLRYSEDIRGTYPDYYYQDARSPSTDDPGNGELPGMIAPKMRGILLFTGVRVKGHRFKDAFAMPADLFVAGGGGEEVFLRKFGYRPFRYVELVGYPGEPDLETITGVVLHSDLEKAGAFTCSDTLLNRIEEASHRTLLYNLHGVIHDNIGAEKGFFPHIASLNFSINAYRDDYATISQKMLEDVRVFTRNESLASICFGFRQAGRELNPGGTISEMQHYTELPWQHYLFYGDRRELQKHYSFIKKYLDHWYPDKDAGKELIYDHWSDHVAFTSGYDIPRLWNQPYRKGKRWYHPKKVKPWANHLVPNEYYGTTTGHKFVGTAARIASLLGQREDAEYFRKLQANIAETVRDHFYDTGQKTFCPEAITVQGANALALYCGVAGREDASILLDKVEKDMEENWNGHLSTGSRCSYPLLAEFSRYGRVDESLKIMQSTDYPSLGQMLSYGTSTIGECWPYPEAPPIASHCQAEGFTQMTRWFYEWLCGLSPDPAKPGFKHFFVRPQIPSDLSSASMHYESNYGRIDVSWSKQDDLLKMRLTVPPNATATVRIPIVSKGYNHEELLCKVAEGKYPLEKAPGVKVIVQDEQWVECLVKAGSYIFTSPLY